MTRQERIDAAIAACTECNRDGFSKRPDCDGCIAAVDEAIAADDNQFSPMLRNWRAAQGFGVLRLRKDVAGADARALARNGDLVLAHWVEGDPNIADGWRLDGVGFLCVLNEPDIEVVERP